MRPSPCCAPARPDRPPAWPEHPATRVQAAYLWQVVEPPGTPDARRGTITSLRAVEGLEPSALARDIEGVLAAARTAPDTVDALFTALENRSRTLLQEPVPASHGR